MEVYSISLFTGYSFYMNEITEPNWSILLIRQCLCNKHSIIWSVKKFFPIKWPLKYTCIGLNIDSIRFVWTPSSVTNSLEWLTVSWRYPSLVKLESLPSTSSNHCIWCHMFLDHWNEISGTSFIIWANFQTYIIATTSINPSTQWPPTLRPLWYFLLRNSASSIERSFRDHQYDHQFLDWEWNVPKSILDNTHSNRSLFLSRV